MGSTSTEIDLWFTTFPPSASSLRQGLPLHIVRLFCEVQFRAAEGWSDSRMAVVDTGAPTSLVPKSIWDPLDVTVLGDDEIGGVVRRPECRLPVVVGRLTAALLSSSGERALIGLTAHLASTDDVPLVIGYRDVLTDFALHADYRTGTAYLTTRRLRNRGDDAPDAVWSGRERETQK